MAQSSAPVYDVLKIIFSAGSIRATTIFKVESSSDPAVILRSIASTVEAGILPELAANNALRSVEVAGITYI